MMFAGLFVILGLVLLLPFLVKKVERELEAFLFIMGCASVTITSQWHWQLVKEGLLDPIKITAAVFVFGLLFRAFQRPIARNVNRAADALGVKLFSFLAVALLGFLSSVITAIIAALLLVEIVGYLKLGRKHEITLVILACFSIGLGAALTPIGEPLSTIVVVKLRGLPYQAGFFFLLIHLGRYIVPGVLAFGLLSMFMMPSRLKRQGGMEAARQETLKDISLRAGKVYLFVMALIFLGKGFKPIIDAYVSRIPSEGLYWLNMISAILDNATLTAAEIGPSMGLAQIKAALLGLLIAGGMLIPGNIPNIIAAGKLKIKSSEWARFGVPLGLLAMLIYFFFLLI